MTDKVQCAICGEYFEPKVSRWQKALSIYLIGVLFLNMVLGLVLVLVGFSHWHESSGLFMVFIGSFFFGSGLYPFVGSLSVKEVQHD